MSYVVCSRCGARTSQTVQLDDVAVPFCPRCLLILDAVPAEIPAASCDLCHARRAIRRAAVTVTLASGWSSERIVWACRTCAAAADELSLQIARGVAAVDRACNRFARGPSAAFEIPVAVRRELERAA